jgi:hypothetical protein
LRRIAGHSEVGGTESAEVLVEHRLVCVELPPVGDRVAVQKQIDVALLRRRDEAFVPRSHALIGLRERRGHVQPRLLQQHQRLELLEQHSRRRSVLIDQALQRGIGLFQFGRCGPWNRDFRWHRRRRSDHHRCEAAATGARRAARALCECRTNTGTDSTEDDENDQSLGHGAILDYLRPSYSSSRTGSSHVVAALTFTAMCVPALPGAAPCQ